MLFLTGLRRINTSANRKRFWHSRCTVSRCFYVQLTIEGEPVDLRELHVEQTREQKSNLFDRIGEVPVRRIRFFQADESRQLSRSAVAKPKPSEHVQCRTPR